jgi:tetratricopeptide (TPR) repeat protein
VGPVPAFFFSHNTKTKRHYRHDITIRRGRTHVSTNAGDRWENLAGLFNKQEKHDEAEALYQRSLEIFEKVSGSDHPHTAAALDNLAVLADDLCRYDVANSSYQRARNRRWFRLSVKL